MCLHSRSGGGVNSFPHCVHAFLHLDPHFRLTRHNVRRRNSNIVVITLRSACVPCIGRAETPSEAWTRQTRTCFIVACCFFFTSFIAIGEALLAYNHTRHIQIRLPSSFLNSLHVFWRIDSSCLVHIIVSLLLRQTTSALRLITPVSAFSFLLTRGVYFPLVTPTCV